MRRPLKSWIWSILRRNTSRKAFDGSDSRLWVRHVLELNIYITSEAEVSRKSCIRSVETEEFLKALGQKKDRTRSGSAINVLIAKDPIIYKLIFLGAEKLHDIYLPTGLPTYLVQVFVNPPTIPDL